MMRSYLIHDLLENSARQYPDKIAVKDGARRLTYQQLHEDSMKVGNLLKALKAEKGGKSLYSIRQVD